MSTDVTALLAFAIQSGASDVHLSSGQSPMIRLDGSMKRLDHPALSREEVHVLVYDIMDDGQRNDFDVFPAAQQAQIGTQFADTIEAIITQTLCKKKAGGRAGTLEIFVATHAVRNLIREGKVHPIPFAMQVGQKDGMQTMDMAFIDLTARGLINRRRSTDQEYNSQPFWPGQYNGPHDPAQIEKRSSTWSGAWI